MKMKAYTTIDSYIKDYPKDVQVLLKQMRATIHKAVPKATEAMKYGIPTFVLNGNLVHFGGFKNHIGFFPGSGAVVHFQKELKKYETSKGTIQFPLDQKLPLSLVTKITKHCVKVREAKMKEKENTSGGTAYIKYHNDGSIWAKGKTIGGKMEGYWQWYRKPTKGKKVGTIMRSGYFAKGKQAGVWTTYDSKGKVYKITRMKD